jgi:hypothetical protein
MAQTHIVDRLLILLLISHQLTILTFEIRNKFGVSCVRFFGTVFEIPYFILQLSNLLCELVVPDSAFTHLSSQLSDDVVLGRYVCVIIRTYSRILNRGVNGHIDWGINNI